MPDKIKRNIFISIILAALIYLGFSLYADFDLVLTALSVFNWLLIPLILSLTYLNYLVRFYKWDYYLRIINVTISKLDSFAIFMSGLIMSVTPGKMGELLKSYLVKQVSGEPISKTAPVVLVERITDFISLVLLALIGAFVFDYGRTIVVIVGIVFLLIPVFISNRRLSLYVISLFGKIPFIKKYIESIHSAYESSYIMLRPVPLLYMTIVSLFSWFFECFAYYIILINFEIDISLLWATFSYTFATIVGAVSMLPGGLGLTDGSLTYFIIREGYAAEQAVVSTFIIRAATLWFAVLVGIISISLYQKRIGKISLDSLNNK